MKEARILEETPKKNEIDLCGYGKKI